mmetsp:Transcript_16600/g.35944  ORF Transcript_16600/g.35944 Transcript_16600/m.35944 type:complete len:152 (-) Transcript_16600:121-576(-)
MHLFPVSFARGVSTEYTSSSSSLHRKKRGFPTNIFSLKRSLSPAPPPSRKNMGYMRVCLCLCLCVIRTLRLFLTLAHALSSSLTSCLPYPTRKVPSFSKTLYSLSRSSLSLVAFVGYTRGQRVHTEMDVEKRHTPPLSLSPAQQKKKYSPE